MRVREYGPAVDVWSIGCILAELLRQGMPLFQGSSEAHQFQLICETIGYPTKEEWPDFFEEDRRDFRKEMERNSVHRRNNLRLRMKGVSENCLDLLGRVLRWDPARRLPLAEVLRHPYFYEAPKAFFPDEIKVLNKLDFYSRKSSEELNRKKK